MDGTAGAALNQLAADLFNAHSAANGDTWNYNDLETDERSVWIAVAQRAQEILA